MNIMSIMNILNIMSVLAGAWREFEVGPRRRERPTAPDGGHSGCDNPEVV
jgi:hypothetical protein